MSLPMALGLFCHIKCWMAQNDHHFCCVSIDTHGETVCSDWTRRVSMCYWSEEMTFIHVVFHTSDWQQASAFSVHWIQVSVPRGIWSKWWAIAVAMYECQIAFKSTTAHGNVEALSRLPLPVQPLSMPMPTEIVCLITYPSQQPDSEVDKERSTAFNSSANVQSAAICTERLPKCAAKQGLHVTILDSLWRTLDSWRVHSVGFQSGCPTGRL